MKNITFKNFCKKAEEAGLIPIDHGNGHWQLTGGPLIVNYYPHSKRQTIYVCGTTGGTNFASLGDAIQAVLKAPSLKNHLEKCQRSQNKSRTFKKRLFKRSNLCNWCGIALTRDTATLDHVIPLARGGLDNMNNVVLACQPCNQKRGCDMPELKGEKCNAKK